jgi:hypothetical protein
MYKSICVVAILLAAFASMSGSRSADASPTTPSSPVIVAKGKLVNQTAPIPTTTIFTPTQSGLYRLSVYMVTTVTDHLSLSLWDYQLNWSDAAGAEQCGGQGTLIFTPYVLTLPGGTYPNVAWASNSASMPGQVVAFQAVAGFPITYSVMQSGGSDNSAYALYYTLERLE